MWPFNKTEKRESQGGFTSLVESAILASVSGQSLGSPLETAALEHAVSLYQTIFSRAVPKPQIPGWTPEVAALVARSLIRSGESVHLLEIHGGEMQILPVGSFDVSGGSLPGSWWYRCDLFAPSSNRTEFVSSDQVLHFKYSIDSTRPWRGIGPMQWARATGSLTAALELRLSEEASAPVSHLLPVPSVSDDPDVADAGLGQVARDIRSAAGQTVLVESVSNNFGEGGQAPNKDWVSSRIGANPPMTLDSLRQNSYSQILAACGVPPGFIPGSDGTLAREAWRQLAMGSGAALLARVASEIHAKMGIAVEFDLSSLWAHDVLGKASAFKALVTGGMPVDQALSVSGLMGDG